MKGWIVRILVALGIGLVLVYTLFPVAWLISTALKTPAEIAAYPPRLIPSEPTVGSFVAVIRGYDRFQSQELPIMRELQNSVVVGLGAVLLSVPIGSLAAYAVVRSRSKILLAFMLFVLLARTIPALSVAIPLYFVVRTLGLLDTNLGLILAHLTLTVPLVLFMMYTFFQDFPEELEEAAVVDGCTRFQSLVRVVIPVTAPGIAVSAILAFVLSYNEFLFSLILMSTPRGMTLPVGISMFILQSGIQWDLLSAGATLGIIPLIIFGYLVQRHIVRGLAFGAIKG